MRAAPVLLVALLVAGCTAPDPAPAATEDGVQAPAVSKEQLLAEHCGGRAPDPVKGANPGWSFVEATVKANLTHKVGGVLAPSSHPMETLGGGVAAADVDGDGWTDLFVADAGPDRLWRNVGGRFEDVTARSGVADVDAGRAALLFDMDADGDKDLLVGNFQAPSRLWRNDGGWRFTDVTAEAGVGRADDVQGLAAVDVDGDGDLDVSVANYGPWYNRPAESNADAHDGSQDLLWINDGAGVFTEEAVARGIVETRWTLSHAWADFDRDGDQDLYHNNDFGLDALYVNDGTGRFTDRAAELGAVTDGNGMGAVWADVDTDGDLDLFATAIHIACNGGVPQFEGNDLFRNDGGRFTDVATEVGIADGMWGWGSAWADFDLDGDLDALQANGWQSRGPFDRYHDAFVYLADEPPTPPATRNDGTAPSTAYLKYNATKYVVWSFFPAVSKADIDTSSQGGHQPDRFWLNEGGRFRDASDGLGLGEWEDAHAYVPLDFDRDGDVDVVRSAWQKPLQLFENPVVPVDGAVEGKHWLEVALDPTRSNPDAIGAIVEVSAGATTWIRHVAASGSFITQPEALVHVGLGAVQTVDEVVVTWPSGAISTLRDVPADQRLRITEPA